MKFLAAILLLGVCFSHWTIGLPFSPRSYILKISNETLTSIIIVTGNDPTDIDLSKIGINYIEENVFDNLTYIKQLDLSNNEIERLSPRIFSALNALETLSLANNKISDIKGSFIGLKNLKNLNLLNNRISELQRGDLFGLTEFTDIIIEGNELKLISADVFQDPSVPILKFESEYQIYYEFADEFETFDQPLPHDFEVKICKSDDGTMKSVERWNKNEELNDCIRADIDRIERILDLSHLGLIKFERGWYKLPPYTISEIDLSFNSIVKITPELFNDLPPGLTAVNCAFNHVNMIRNNVINNTHIKKLIFNSNLISSIDDHAFENIKLLILHAGDNNLENLDFLQSLTAIEDLYLAFNFIEQIFGDTFRGLKKLRIIDLTDNFLDSIEPGTFKDQKNLLELRLASNSIVEFNHGLFKGLENIKYLDFADNEIRRISKNTFAELRNLKDLEIHLNENSIKVIEEGSFSLLNLISLNLSFNQIDDVSIANGAFEGCRVQKLALTNNYITKIDSKVFSDILGSYELNLHGNSIAFINNGDVEYLSNVSALNLDFNPIEYLENGVLYGLSKNKDVKISLHKVPVKVIQGGLFQEIDRMADYPRDTYF